MTIAELAALIGVDLDKASFDATDAAIKATTKQLRLMAVQAKMATTDVTKAMGVIGLPGPGGAPEAASKLGKAADALGFVRRGLLALVGIDAGRRLLHTVHGAVELGDKFGDLADKTGATSAELQELAYAGELEDVSLETLSATLGKLNMNLAKASHGSKEQAANFHRAGIAVKDANGKVRPAVDVLGDIADHLQSLDETERPARAMELLGRQGRELIPLLKKGSAGLAEFRQEARDMGLVLDEQTLAAMDEADKSSKRLGKAWEGLKLQAAKLLLPALEDLTHTLLDWIKTNRKDITDTLAAAFKLVVLAVKGLVTGLKIVTSIFAFLQKNWGLTIAILFGLVAAFIALEAASIAAAIESAIAWAIAAAPIVLLAALIAAIILIVEDLYMAFTGGESVLKDLYLAAKKWIGDNLGEMWDNLMANVTAFGQKVLDFLKAIGHEIKEVIKDLTGGAFGVFGESNLGDITQRAGEAERLGLTGAEREKFIGEGTLPQAFVPQVALPATEGGAGGPVTATAHITNNFTVTGDADEMRRVAREEQALTARQLQVTIGGALFDR